MSKRVKLCVHTKTDSTFTFVCDSILAGNVLQEYTDGVTCKIKVNGVLDCVDAHQTEAIFEVNSIECVQAIEIKNL